MVRFNGFANQSASLVVNRAGIVSGIQNNNTDNQEVLKETEVIRDLLYVFQGIHGTHILYSAAEDAFTLRSNYIISHSMRKIINELCELGWLYKKVNDWMKIQ